MSFPSLERTAWEDFFYGSQWDGCTFSSSRPNLLSVLQVSESLSSAGVFVLSNNSSPLTGKFNFLLKFSSSANYFMNLSWLPPSLPNRCQVWLGSYCSPVILRTCLCYNICHSVKQSSPCWKAEFHFHQLETLETFWQVYVEYNNHKLSHESHSNVLVLLFYHTYRGAQRLNILCFALCSASHIEREDSGFGLFSKQDPCPPSSSSRPPVHQLPRCFLQL